jgi:hypothetical protein
MPSSCICLKIMSLNLVKSVSSSPASTHANHTDNLPKIKETWVLVPCNIKSPLIIKDPLISAVDAIKIIFNNSMFVKYSYSNISSRSSIPVLLKF